MDEEYINRAVVIEALEGYFYRNYMNMLSEDISKDFFQTSKGKSILSLNEIIHIKNKLNKDISELLKMKSEIQKIKWKH